MIDLACAIVNCTKVSRADHYCARHHKNVVIDGEDPIQLRHAKIFTDKQCPAVVQYDGANCCSLIDGHTGPHENVFGSRHGTWGTAAEWLEKTKGLYRMPPVMAVPAPPIAKIVPLTSVPASVHEKPKSLLPAKLARRKK